MKNVLFYLILILLVTTIASIVLGYHTFGFTVGFILAGLTLSTGLFYSFKNSDYSHKQWHNDYVERNRRRK